MGEITSGQEPPSPTKEAPKFVLEFVPAVKRDWPEALKVEFSVRETLEFTARIMICLA